MGSSSCEATLQLVDDHAAQRGNGFRPFTQGAIADDGVFGIGVDVEHGCIVERHAHRGQLRRKRLRKSRGQLRVVAASQHRHRRPLRKRRSQPRNTPAFLIDPDPRRPFRTQGFRIGRQAGHLLRRLDVAEPPKERHAAKIELPRHRSQLRGNDRTHEAADQQLTDPPAERLRRHDLSL